MPGVCEFKVPTKINRSDFWTAVEVWVTKPHVVNRRLWGCSLLHSFRMLPLVSDPTWDAYENFISLQSLTQDQLRTEEHFLDLLTKNMGLELTTDYEIDSIEINIVKLLPKLGTETCVYQLIAKHLLKDVIFFAEILNKENQHNLAPRFPYSFDFSDGVITLKVYDYQSDPKGVKWLQGIVLPQIVKWGKDSPNETKNNICSGSLSLVPNEVYYNKYNELKLKYGKEMVKIWPESTDPIKFVYEDVAIATYLLVLWESERARLKLDRQQTFVDLGCGNGLLVHILTGEGHRGHGVDVRRRNIWDIYPKTVLLQEHTISPSDVNLFPDTDWIIGNHSDELTPWVPIIAARSSYKCNFFVLPCCCYNINGSKYQRKDSSKSLYTDYLDYIQQLCKRCGFETSVDRLKIPSTKRICLVGTDRTYPLVNFNEMCNAIQGFIADGKETDQWISDFKPRQPIEKVRNCTQIEKSVIDSIIQIITNHLVQDCKPEEAWSKGRAVELNAVAKLVPAHMLKSLKSECGGLQTLLKNQHQIFKIECGKVELRHPQSVSEVIKRQRNTKSTSKAVSVKQRSCWFYNNHPQGCPLTDEDCSFLHSGVR